jgi:hypothetical protein
VRWQQVGTLALRYVPGDEFIKYETSGAGQFFGSMEGRLELEGLAGNVRLTNLALRRADGTFEPTLRGVVTVDEGVVFYVTIDGLSVTDRELGPNHRDVYAMVRLRSSDARYEEWNRAFLVYEARGGPVDGSWGVSGTVLRGTRA